MMVLAGCRSDPLGSYLQGLGAWRAVVRTADPDARAHWNAGRMVLSTNLGVGELVSALIDRFEPLPIVSPWNAGSGFAGNGKNVEAERALAAIRESADSRFATLRVAVLAADEIVAAAKAAGWGGKGEKIWDDARKPDLLRLCRNRLPDAAVAWLDAVAALRQDSLGEQRLTYSRLLGTGANFGRQDLQSTYVRRSLMVLQDSKGMTFSRGWLRGALFGEESTPYLREAVGQFDPGRAGGIQSSPGEKNDDTGFANPWSFMFTIEGALLFASAATRRQGAGNSDAAIPFVIRASNVGYGSSATNESALGEVWTPEWDRPSTLAEIEHLIGEGRAQWGKRPARDGLEFAQAVATLGVDRGVRRFVRSVFAERLGQNPLAIPVGVVEVVERGAVGLLRPLDSWLGRLRDAALPSGVEARLRALDESIYALATAAEPASLRRVLIDIGRLHEAVGRSGKTAERVKPLTIGNGNEWWARLRPIDAGEVELRVAAALAAGRDRDVAGRPVKTSALRQLVTPIVDKGNGNIAWADRSRVGTAGGLVAAIAAAHRLRAIPGSIREPQDCVAQDERIQPAVKGIYSAFTHGPITSLADAAELVSGFRDELFDDYARGLMLLNLWSNDDSRTNQLPSLIPPTLAVLVPFYARQPFRLRLADDDLIDTTILLRPDSSWLPRLHAGDLRGVLRDATDRLRITGFRGVIDADAVAVSVDPDRLAAALLVPVHHADRIAALRRIAILPSTQQIQGVPA